MDKPRDVVAMILLILASPFIYDVLEGVFR